MNANQGLQENSIRFWYKYTDEESVEFIYKVVISISKKNNQINYAINNVTTDEPFTETEIYIGFGLKEDINNKNIKKKIYEEINRINENQENYIKELSDDKKLKIINNREKILNFKINDKELDYIKLKASINESIKNNKFKGEIDIKPGMWTSYNVVYGGKRLSNKIRKIKKHKRTKRRKSIKNKNQKRK